MSLLLFSNDRFGIKQLMKVYMALNKETKIKPVVHESLFNFLIFVSEKFNLRLRFEDMNGIKIDMTKQFQTKSIEEFQGESGSHSCAGPH